MRFGLVYSTPRLYDLVMRLLYRRLPGERFDVVAAEVGDQDDVVDLCAGTAMMFKALSGKQVTYQAYDVNEGFVRHLKGRGIKASCCDVASMEIPVCDVVTMSSALYHFHPCCREMVQKMCASARKKVVLVEPIVNNSNSGLAVWGAFARWMTRVDGKDVPFHFDSDSLNALIDEVDLKPQQRRAVCGGRDLLVVLPGTAA
jgi:hypothetical protein